MIKTHGSKHPSTLSLLSGRSRILKADDTPVVFNEQWRIERILAVARTFLALTSFVAIGLDPTEPAEYAHYAYGLMGLYAIYSLGVQFLVLAPGRSSPALPPIVHMVDTIWPALIGIFTSGPGSPFYIYNVFVLSAAAYRWGFGATLATAGSASILYTLEGILAPVILGSMPAYLGDGFQLNHTLLRAINLLIMGYLLGYLGEQQKLLHAEASATARITGRIHSEKGLRAAVQDVMDEVCRIFASQRVLIILNEIASGRLFVWDATWPQRGQPVAVASLELVGDDQARYGFDPPAAAWHAVLRAAPGGTKSFELVSLDGSGRRQPNATWTPPLAFFQAHDGHQLLGASLRPGDEWGGCLIIFDPVLSSTPHAAMSFMLALSRYVGPALYNVYLTRRMRTKAGAVERARVARELHDGVIQSLIGLEMQVDVLRRQQAHPPEQMTAELNRIQLLLRQEVLNLRELMQQMTPVNIGPKQLLDFLAYTVDKFRRDTGIAAAFTSPLSEAALGPRVSIELARILQEALVNVRKHSGARNVLVRFDSADGKWILVVDDDGRGFDFSGHLKQDDLDIARRGPMVIKERVRSINGELTIDSVPHGGARLEITIPKKSYG